MSERELGQLRTELTGERENLGTRIVRNIFHYWSHIGEISAIRQMLGHDRPPQFVDTHDWSYRDTVRPGSRPHLS